MTQEPPEQRKEVAGVEPRKDWSWLDERGERSVEATGELPVMYIALGSKPKTTHPFNLYRDIMSIPQALRDTLKTVPDSVAAVAEQIIRRGLTRVIGVGLGTSQFVAMGAATALWNLAGWDAEQADAGEFLISRRNWDLPHSAFLVFSGSGRTVDSNRAAEKARADGAYTVSVVSVPHSPLTRITDATIVCQGGFDTGGSDTFHYATRLAVAMLLAIELGERTDPKRCDFAALREQLYNVPDWLEAHMPELDGRCRSIARQYCHARSVLTVGGGPNLATAEEAALKFDEMAHIPGKAMCPGRHIHGALGLTDEHIVTLIIAPPGPSYPWLRQVAQATVGLKTPSIGFVCEDDNDIAAMMDYVVRLPVVDETIFTIPATVPAQLLPYYCAVEQGTINPDCQRSNIPRYARVWMQLFPPGTH